MQRPHPTLLGPKHANSPIGRAVARIREFLYIPEIEIVYAVLGAAAANMVEGEPVWLMIIGAPGGGKSEMVNMLLGLRHVHEAANFSGAAAFLSGTNAKEKSKDATGGLLRQVGNHGAIVINDYTSVLSLDPVKRGEVMSVLRECYSGRWTRPIGEGGGRNLQWVGKLMVLAGCTNELDRHHQISSAMGERWVYLRLDPGNLVRMQISGGKKTANGLGPGFAQALAALRNSGKPGWREKLRAIVTELYEEVGIGFGKISPRRTLTDAEDLRIIRMASVSARCRSTVPEDHYTKEVTDISDVEMESRIATALGQLYIGLELIGVESKERWSTVGRVALDSMPRLRRFILDTARSGAPKTADEMAVLAGCSKSVVRRAVEHMSILGVVAKDKQIEGEKPVVKLTAWMKENLEKGWR